MTSSRAAAERLGVPLISTRTPRHAFRLFLPRRGPLSCSLASQACGAAEPSGSVASGAFQGRKCDASDGGKSDDCDDDFFHLLSRVLTLASSAFSQTPVAPCRERVVDSGGGGHGSSTKGGNCGNRRSVTPRIRGYRDNLSVFFSATIIM